MDKALVAALAWVDALDDIDSEDLANCTEESEAEVRHSRILAAAVRSLKDENKRLEGAATQMSRAARSLEKRLESTNATLAAYVRDAR